MGIGSLLNEPLFSALSECYYIMRQKNDRQVTDKGYGNRPETEGQTYVGVEIVL